MAVSNKRTMTRSVGRGGQTAAYSAGVGRARPAALLSAGPLTARPGPGVGWNSAMRDVCAPWCRTASKLYVSGLLDDRVRPCAASGLSICCTR